MDLVLDKATAIPWYHSNVTRFTLSAGKVNLESIFNYYVYLMKVRVDHQLKR